MKALAEWKRKLVEKEPDREGHMDMLKVAMWNSYINRVDYMRKLKLKKIVKNVDQFAHSARSRSIQRKASKEGSIKSPDKSPGKSPTRKTPALKKPDMNKFRGESITQSTKQQSTNRKAVNLANKTSK